MFLLLARDPACAGLVLAVSLAAGIVSGYAVDAVHGPRFLQPRFSSPSTGTRRIWFDGKPTACERLWLALLAPGLVLGIAGAMRMETDARLTATIGIGGALLALGIWLIRGGGDRNCRDGACAVRSQGRELLGGYGHG